MDTTYTLRNLQVKPQNAEDLERLRSGKWRPFHAEQIETLAIDGQPVRFRSGLTLTPFANATPCNAHCRFCSEELRRKHQAHLTAERIIGDYGEYFAALSNALADLAPLQHLGLSLSGLEATSEPLWLLELLELLSSATPRPAFNEWVLYTNGSGLYTHPELISALEQAQFDRLELSRCHYDEAKNQRIMYFNRNQPVHKNQAYEELMQRLQGRLLVKNSCILTKEGIDSLPEIERYLDWALSLGADTVVFRELSRLNEDYEENRTKVWTDEHRVSIDPIFRQIGTRPGYMRKHWDYDHSTQGYYYYNEHYWYRGSLKVILEVSSYEALIERNEEAAIQKLVFHSNGNLCGDWDPDSHVIKNYLHA